jgi:acyl-CoA synthetase (AMP-forming)/AMP-acid ligase II
MTIQFPQLAIGDWISAAARKWPNAPCFISPIGELADVDQTRTQSFYETNQRVIKLAHAFDSAGLRVGDRVAILAVDSIEHIEVILACAKVGLTYCDLNFRLREDEILNILSRSSVSALFYNKRYSETVGRIKSEIQSLTFSCCIDCGSADSEFESLIKETPLALEYAAKSYAEDILSIMFTSGTTSVPKGVLQSERMMRNIVYSFNREIRIQPGGLQYSGASLFHVSGICSVFHALLAGRASLILPQFDATAVQKWLSDGQITSCTLIPTMISEILEIPGADQGNYDSLQSILYGGSAMSPTLLMKMMRVFDCDLYNGLGAGTEAGIQTMLYPEDHRAAAGGSTQLFSSIGKPIMGVDLRLCDDEMRDVDEGDIGEIVTRSETIMSGYLGQPELTAHSIVDGWFRAGDMAYRDSDGYLYLATRKSDMIIRGGENVYPIEIESVISEHPSVLEVAVVGIPDDHWGEIVAAAVAFRKGESATTEEIQRLCRSRLATYKIPEKIFVYESLPKNSTNKIVKSEVSEMVFADLGEN